jgi:cytochrome b561
MKPAEDGRRWSPATIALHWLSALTIISLLALGLIMTHAITDTAQRFDLYQVHKSLGFVALFLLACRVAARMISRTPTAFSVIAWERRAATAMHGALYLFTFVATISGWVTASATIIPVPIQFFRLFTIPNIVASNPALEKQASLVHTVATWSIIVLVAVHVLAALKHHLVDRDDTLRRMIPDGSLAR